MQVRRKLVVGNWKMNGSISALGELPAIGDAARAAPAIDIAICPPVTLIAPAVIRSGGLTIGAQDCHPNDSGPHTGCVSVQMVKEAGARLVIIGHSERRSDQRESDELIRAKAEAVMKAGLMAIVCIGETDEQRRARDHLAVVTRQLEESVPDAQYDGELVIAYEPIWAIGTGNVATPHDVAEMHGQIRFELEGRFGDIGQRIRILYGGSVKGDNAAELFALDNVDGALVGGASLTAAQFIPIIEAAAG